MKKASVLLAVPLAIAFMVNAASAAFTLTITNVVDEYNTAGNIFATATTTTGPAVQAFNITGIVVNYTNDVTGITTTFSNTSSFSNVAPGTTFQIGSYSIGQLDSPMVEAFSLDVTVQNLTVPADSGTINGVVGTVTGIPEPGTLGLLSVGALGFIARRRRRA